MNYEDIKKDIHFLTNTNDNSYKEEDIVRNLNNWLRQVWIWIENSDADWQFNDNNKTNTPIGRTDLIKGQSKYRMDSDALTVERIEVKDNNGNWFKLTDINETDINIGLEEFQETDAIPRYYDMMGNEINLYPAPDYNSSKGLKGIFSRDIVEFSTDDDTFTPGIPAMFHRILSYGAALDYCVANSASSKEADLRRLIYGGSTNQGLKSEVEEFFAKRQRDSSMRFGIKRGDYSS